MRQLLKTTASHHHASAATSRAPGQARGLALPAPLRNGIEALSGLAMHDVQVHHDSPQPAQLGALAFARGRDIHLAPGQAQQLPHEAWHVVQQAQGRVRPTLQLKQALHANADPALEQEADQMGARALALGGHGQGLPLALAAPAAPGGAAAVLQLARAEVGSPSFPLDLAAVEQLSAAIDAEIAELALDDSEVQEGHLDLVQVQAWHLALGQAMAALRQAQPGAASFGAKDITGRVNPLASLVYNVFAVLTPLRKALNQSLTDQAIAREMAEANQQALAYQAEHKAAQISSKSRREAPVEEKPFVPTTEAEKLKEKAIADYLDLVDHLGGEGGGSGTAVLKGGHLLSAMKATYPNLVLSGTPDPHGVWEGWWSDGVAPPKWSSFFPSSWSRADVVQKLRHSSSVNGGRDLPGGITVSKTGGTFYPWHDKTLAKPALAAMRRPD